ncbi:MAG: hypothetical protein J6S67_16510 [Methanobrevibacter sp.]|nr:hypothetical protein [Methanobrevibacter sp.]
MATLTYYTFSKRDKSTLQPISGTDVEIYLKDGCSLTKPVFILNWSGVPTFNYVRFENRYYFVTDVVSVRNDYWEIQCEEDYLASWKTVIGNTEAMILYASGGRSDIIDNRIPITSPVYVSQTPKAIDGITITDGNQGTIILSITGVGSFGNYVMQNSTQIFDLIRDVDNFFRYIIAGATDPYIEVDFQRLLNGNVADNLKGAIALPILSPAMTQGALENLYLGTYPCVDQNDHNIKGYRITDPLATGSCVIDIPWRYSDWRRHSPYSSLYLYLPLIGTIQLPTDELIGESSITVLYSVNITSGDVAVEVRATSNNKVLTTASGNCAMATPYGSANISSAKVGSAIVTGIAGIAGAALAPTTGGATLALFGGLTASAGQMLNAIQGETKGGGGLSGGASHGLTKLCVLTCVSKELTDSQSDLDPIIGKPVMRKQTISTYSGFVQTDGAQVAGDMLDSERQMINDLLDGGFYYD